MEDLWGFNDEALVRAVRAGALHAGAGRELTFSDFGIFVNPAKTRSSFAPDEAVTMAGAGKGAGAVAGADAGAGAGRTHVAASATQVRLSGLGGSGGRVSGGGGEAEGVEGGRGRGGDVRADVGA